MLQVPIYGTYSNNNNNFLWWLYSLFIPLPLFKQEYFLEDEMVLVIPYDSDLKNKELNLDDLQDMRWIAREEGSGTREYLDLFFTQNKIIPKSKNITQLPISFFLDFSSDKSLLEEKPNSTVFGISSVLSSISTNLTLGIFKLFFPFSFIFNTHLF